MYKTFYSYSSVNVKIYLFLFSFRKITYLQFKKENSCPCLNSTPSSFSSYAFSLAHVSSGWYCPQGDFGLAEWCGGKVSFKGHRSQRDTPS